MIKIALFAAILAAAYAAPSGHYANAGYGYNGFYGAAGHVQDYNGIRQARVNNIAEHVGAGTGTADYNGVPGTRVRKTGYGTHAAAGYGTHGYGLAQGYGTHAHGTHGYGTHGFGVGTHGYGLTNVHGAAPGYVNNAHVY